MAEFGNLVYVCKPGWSKGRKIKINWTPFILPHEGLLSCSIYIKRNHVPSQIILFLVRSFHSFSVKLYANWSALFWPLGLKNEVYTWVILLFLLVDWRFVSSSDYQVVERDLTMKRSAGYLLSFSIFCSHKLNEFLTPLKDTHSLSLLFFIYKISYILSLPNT